MRHRFIHLFAAIASVGTLAAGSLHAQGPERGNRGMLVLPAPELEILRSMSDANIIGHLITADSLEVAISDSAIARSKSDTVTNLARAMRSEHLASMNAYRQIAKEAGLRPLSISNDLRVTHMFSKPDSVGISQESTVDRHYVMEQAELHRHMLAELETLQGVAQNQHLKEHITAAIAEVRDHLMKVNAVAKAKGIDLRRPRS